MGLLANESPSIMGWALTNVRIGLGLFLLILYLATALWAEPAQEPPELVYFERMAVVPFFVGERRPEMEKDQEQDQFLSCKINEICVNDPSLAPEAGPTLTRLAYQQLTDRFPPHVVPLDQSRTAFARIRLDRQADTLLAAVRRMGDMLDADLIMLGTVWRFRDRGAIQAIPDSPASVAFALYLVRADSGELLWRQMYEGTQETVFSNLFKAGERIKMGLTWLSAEELAGHGMGEVFKKFPERIQPVVTPKVRY